MKASDCAAVQRNKESNSPQPPHRRDLLKAAMTAPALPLVRLTGGDGVLFAQYAAWLTLRDDIGRTLTAQNAAEEAAFARGVDWDDCPTIADAYERVGQLFRERDRTICAAAALPAASLDGIAVKLALWRRAALDVGRGLACETWDRLAFSAYRDLIAYAGRSDLAHSDDALLAAALLAGPEEGL